MCRKGKMFKLMAEKLKNQGSEILSEQVIAMEVTS